MKCPKCGSTENIKFFLRHQKDNEEDDSSVANCITIIHAEPQCGFNESYLLEDCLDVIFPNWSEIQELEEKIENIQNAINAGSLLEGMLGNDSIEIEGEAIDENEDVDE